MPRKRMGRSRFGLGALALGGAAAIGAIVVSLVPLQLPRSLQNAPTPQEISISSHAFTDERPVEITVIQSRAYPATTPASGLVTSYDCTVGEEIASGTSFFAVDGAPILALATDVPLWRDLAMGDSGADVRGLQSELNRLGYNVRVDGSMGRATLRAASQSMAAAGITWREPTFPVSRTVWLQAPQVTVGECNTTLGARLALGDPIATFDPGQRSITVVNLPGDLVPGPRVVTIGTDVIPVDDAGKSGPIAVHLDAPAQDSSAAGDPSGSRPIAATLSLTEPTRVSSVPPSAIVGLDGPDGCVQSNGEMLHVLVVGSQLGQTFVQFDEGKSPRRIQLHPSQRQCP